MRQFALLGIAVTALMAQTATAQMSLNWLVREDIFSGFLENDRARLEKGVATLERMAPYFPQEKVAVLGWWYTAEMARAVLDLEAGDRIGFDRHYATARVYMGQLKKIGEGPAPLIAAVFEGGVLTSVADRLPPEFRKAAWERAYQAYALLDSLQGAEVTKLPMHLHGESLSGLAATAYRTGREAEMNKALDRMIAGLDKTPYALVAKKWKEDPAARPRVKMVCVSCHEPNRLGARNEKAQ